MIDDTIMIAAKNSSALRHESRLTMTCQGFGDAQTRDVIGVLGMQEYQRVTHALVCAEGKKWERARATPASRGRRRG